MILGDLLVASAPPSFPCAPLPCRCSQVSEPMYALLLQLYGYEKEAPKQQAVSAAMQQLAASCGHASWEALAEQHASTLMGRAIEDAPRYGMCPGATPNAVQPS